MTDSYYHYHPQYHRQLDSLNCTSVCPDPRPDVSNYSDSLSDLIFYCYYIDYGDCPSDYADINCWNTTGITDMDYLLEYTRFNDPLECWDVGQVTTMYRMFAGFLSTYPSLTTIYPSDFNQPIGNWDVSQVENMNGMFAGADKFNQLIDSWNVSQVSDMNYMFLQAEKFNQPIDSWNVSQVEYMTRMFVNVSDFNQCLSTWAEKTPDNVGTVSMLDGTDCPDGIGYPNATIGPWCQDYTQGCFAPGFEPSQQPSDIPSNKPTDVPTKPPTNAPTNSPTTKSQKKKSIKKTKKQVKKKSKKM